MALPSSSRAWRSAAAAALCAAILAAAARPARASPEPAECGAFRDTAACGGVNAAGCCEGYR